MSKYLQYIQIDILVISVAFNLVLDIVTIIYYLVMNAVVSPVQLKLSDSLTLISVIYSGCDILLRRSNSYDY